MGSPKCVMCTYTIRGQERVIAVHADLFHETCYRIAFGRDSIRDASRRVQQSRRRIEEARAAIRRQRSARPERAG